MRFMILFFLSVTSSWAMDDLEREMTPLLIKMDSQKKGKEDRKWNADLVEEKKPFPTLKSGSDIIIDLTQDPLNLPTLPDELFVPLIHTSLKLDGRSLRRLFMVSKKLNERIGKLGIKVWFPSLVLSFSPSVGEVVNVIEDMEKCQRSVGPLTSPEIKEVVQENFVYRAGIKRLSKAKAFFPLSPTFLSREGSAKISAIESFHKKTFGDLSLSKLPTPSCKRQFLSSLARDPWVFRAIAGVTVISAGAFAVMYCWHETSSQQYQLDFENNINFVNTDVCINQYYNGNNDGRTYYAKFPYNTPGCNNVKGSGSAFSHCFNITDYCQGGSSPLTNITDLSAQLWRGVRLPSIHNISIENFQSALSVFFKRSCAENFQKNLSIAHSISRLKPNSPFLLTNEIVDKQLISCHWEPGTNPILSSLFNCDPIAVARGMTPVVQPLWQMITLPAIFLVGFGATCVTFILERCFDLYDDS